LIAALTLLARAVGFGRWFVFAATVGSGCTGSAYAAANQLPNVLFEVAAGGALAGAVVPVLSGLRSAGLDADADRTASALLTWTVIGLVPLSLALAVLAEPSSRILLDGRTVADCGPGVVNLATRMLIIFAPQVVLYGIGIVLTGMLQARHAFAGPALAPLLSSLVVVVAYIIFGMVAAGPDGAPGRSAELVLSVGTTLGVVALSLPMLLPVMRAGARLRPTLRFPSGTVARLRSLVQAGIVTLLAQQAAVLVTIALAGRIGGRGVQPVVLYVQALYLLPYAVLAVPVATAAFPRIAEQVARGKASDAAATTASGARAVVWLSLLGTAELVAVAPAVQHLFVILDVTRSPAVHVLADGLTAFAVGLLGWGLVAHLSRALYALGGARAAATGTAAGWAMVVVASVVTVFGLRAAGVDADRASLIGLGAGTSAGLFLAGGLLLRSLGRLAGPRALVGVRRSIAVAVASAAVAGAAGRTVCTVVDLPPQRSAPAAVTAIGLGVLAGLAALAGFAATAWFAEPGPGRSVDPPRVLQVLATSAGGVGRHVAAVTAWLTGEGTPVVVAGPAATDLAFGLSTTGAHFVPVEITDRPRPGTDLRALVNLRSLAGKADVVHAHGLRAGGLAVLAVRSRRRRPAVVVTLHNALVGGRRIAAVHALLARLVARGADAVLVVSGDLGEQLRGLGARRVGRALVPAPCRPVTGDIAATRAGLGLGPDEKLLVTVARLAPQKGLSLLLDALETLVRDGVPVRAVIAGDGPLRAEVAAEIARRHLPLTLLGRRDDVPDLLAAADVVVVPSLWEGQPLVVQEALRAPAAIVATDVGGIQEVAGDSALLVPYGKPVELADAVVGLVTDPKAWAALRERAAARAETLPTDDDAGRQVLTLYRELLRLPSGSGIG
jgi:putative peptidoglycan lipid II flippase